MAYVETSVFIFIYDMGSSKEITNFIDTYSDAGAYVNWGVIVVTSINRK